MNLYIKLKKIYNDSFIKNSIFLMMTIFFNLILGFFFWAIVAKYYTPYDMGMVSAILSGVSLISIISSIGFPTTLIFYLPRDKKNANRIINSCLIVGILVSFTFSVVFILWINIWGTDLEKYLDNLGGTIIFIFIVLMSTISGLISGALIAGRRSSFHMIKENISGFIKIFPIILLVEFGTIGVLISWGIGLIVSIVIGYILLYKTWRYLPTFTFDPIIKSMMGFSAGNYVAEIFYILPRLLLPIIIVNLISAESAGYFFIAITVASLLYGMSQSISNSLLTESSIGDFWGNVYKAIRFNLFLLISGLLLFVILGKFILGIFNSSYAENATTTLIILAIASIPSSSISIFNTVRNVQKRVGSTIKINAIVAIITLFLSIPLMKILNIEGAALAYLIANIIGAIIIIIRIKNPVEFTLKLLKVKKDVITI